jgi:hypothetical protein
MLRYEGPERSAVKNRIIVPGFVSTSRRELYRWPFRWRCTLCGCHTAVQIWQPLHDVPRTDAVIRWFSRSSLSEEELMDSSMSVCQACFSVGLSTCMARVIVPTGSTQIAWPGSLVLRGYSTCMTWDDISARMTWDATVTLDQIYAATTYVMWFEKHLWNVIVLQRVHLSSFVVFNWLVTFIYLTNKQYGSRTRISAPLEPKNAIGHVPEPVLSTSYSYNFFP